MPRGKKEEEMKEDYSEHMEKAVPRANPMLETIIEHQCKTLDKLDKLMEKTDACLDASKELVKAVGKATEEMGLKRKAGSF